MCLRPQAGGMDTVPNSGPMTADDSFTQIGPPGSAARNSLDVAAAQAKDFYSAGSTFTALGCAAAVGIG
jgi:hypothetical protein